MKRLHLCFTLLTLLIPALWVSRLPDISALESVTAGEHSVVIRDLLGRECYTYTTPDYGEQVPIDIANVPDELIAALLSIEDRGFFVNPGFSPGSILHASFYNLRSGTIRYGASTITQQLVKNILLNPEERSVQSIRRKAKEILLAAAVTLRYDKEWILNLYLNETYFGQHAVGVEQAARSYFGKSVQDLTLAESAFIAGLPQAPGYYGYDLEAGIQRQQEVLWAMEHAKAHGICIPLRRNGQTIRYCPNDADLSTAAEVPLNFALQSMNEVNTESYRDYPDNSVDEDSLY